jgi:hypothetical protein
MCPRLEGAKDAAQNPGKPRGLGQAHGVYRYQGKILIPLDVTGDTRMKANGWRECRNCHDNVAMTEPYPKIFCSSDMPQSLDMPASMMIMTMINMKMVTSILFFKMFFQRKIDQALLYWLAGRMKNHLAWQRAQLACCLGTA